MQWEKLKKSGAYPHLARWAAFLDAQPELADVAAAHGPYKPKAAAEYAKDLAAAGRGGGGDADPHNYPSPSPCSLRRRSQRAR